MEKTTRAAKCWFSKTGRQKGSGHECRNAQRKFGETDFKFRSLAFASNSVIDNHPTEAVLSCNSLVACAAHINENSNNETNAQDCRFDVFFHGPIKAQYPKRVKFLISN